MNKIELSIPPVPLYQNQIEHFTEEIISTFQIPEQYRHNLQQAIAEASLIAKQHNDPLSSSPIKLTAIRSKEKITIRIKQKEGRFDKIRPPRPLTPANKGGLTGQNFYTLLSLADELSFSQQGAQIILSFFI